MNSNGLKEEMRNLGQRSVTVEQKRMILDTGQPTNSSAFKSSENRIIIL
jgi:hypothetical protein